MDNPVVTAVAEALGSAGYAPLRFNWRGVGKSSGTASGRLEDAHADYASALARARADQAAPAALLSGYSFGALAAVLVAAEDPQVERLVLVAPPVTMAEGLDLSNIERPIHVIAAERDTFASPADLAGAFAASRDVRIDVVPDADHFFTLPFWIDKVGELVRASLRVETHD